MYIHNDGKEMVKCVYEYNTNTNCMINYCVV